MRYEMQSNFKGYTVSEYVRMQSKRGQIKLTGEVKLSWSDASLRTVGEAAAMRFLTEFGINLKKKYDGKYKSWLGKVQKALNKLESDLDGKIKKFEKASKKNPVSVAEKTAFEARIEAEKKAGQEHIKADAQSKYSAMLKDIVDAVRSNTLKAMGKEGALLKRGKGTFAWNVLKFTVVVVMVAIAVATLPTGAGAAILGVGVAALVTKSLTSTTSFIKDCIEHKKNYDTAVTKVAKKVDSGITEIDNAIADLRKAQAARDAMNVKIGQAQQHLDNALTKSAPAKKSAAIKKATEKLQAAKKDMQSFDKKLGGQPLEVAAELENVRAAIKKARTNIPVVTKSGSGSIGDILGKLDSAVSMADEVLGGL